MPHGPNAPPRKGGTEDGNLLSSGVSKLIRLTGTLESGRSWFLQFRQDCCALGQNSHCYKAI